MHVLRSAIFSICALVAAQALAFADGNTGVVYVHVLDAKSGKPASSWTVQLTARDGDSQQITGRSGQLVFLTVTPGIARIDVLQGGQLGACPAIIVISANEQAVVNVHVRRTNKPQVQCSPQHAQTMVRPGVTSDVYDIY